MARGVMDPDAPDRVHRANCREYVACPACGAEAGQKCIGTHGQPRYSNHVERWQLFDPAHIAAKATRKEKEVRIEREPRDYEEEQDVTCLHCSQSGLYWQDTWDAAGERRARLFEDGKPHVCKPSADDFEVVS